MWEGESRPRKLCLYLLYIVIVFLFLLGLLYNVAKLREHSYLNSDDKNYTY